MNGKGIFFMVFFICLTILISIGLILYFGIRINSSGIASYYTFPITATNSVGSETKVFTLEVKK